MGGQGKHNFSGMLQNSNMPPTGLACKMPGSGSGWLFGWGITTPSAEEIAAGGLFYDYVSGVLYKNSGTPDSPSFTVVSGVADDPTFPTLNVSTLLTLSGDLKQNVQVLTADGAITVKGGICILNKAGAIDATLAAPATADNGKVLTIVSITAQAHTVTATTIGFNAGDAASDVGTFGGAIGDSIIVVAYGGEWYVIGNTNVTLA